MRIGIDITAWQDRRGFGRFTREIVTHLVRYGSPAHEFVLLTDADTAASVRLPAPSEVRIVHTARPSGAGSGRSRRWRDVLMLGWRAAQCRTDVFFFPAPSTFFPVFGRARVVVAMHDTMTEERPELFFSTRREHLAWKIKVGVLRRQASAFVTPSEDARHRVAIVTKRSLDRVTCIDEAPAACFVKQRHPDDAGRLAGHYGVPLEVPLTLYVGGFDKHKNLATLLRAMVRIRPADRAAWHLVMVGAHTSTAAVEIDALCSALGIHDRVTMTGFVPDEDLARLYNAATLLVLPSLDEGFGLPVVEAMACGLPVAVSDRGSLPDLVGDAGLTFDPESPSDMAAVIERLLDDPMLRLTLSARGLERAARYSWRQSAQRLLQVFASVEHGTAS